MSKKTTSSCLTLLFTYVDSFLHKNKTQVFDIKHISVQGIQCLANVLRRNMVK